MTNCIVILAASDGTIGCVCSPDISEDGEIVEVADKDAVYAVSPFERRRIYD
jgi:hypothetical protein